MDNNTWIGLATVIIANLAGIIGAFAVLIAVIKGGFNVLNEKVDGHLGRMVDALKDAKKVEGKVDALIQNPPTKTEVIMDRRSEER